MIQQQKLKSKRKVYSLDQEIQNKQKKKKTKPGSLINLTIIKKKMDYK